MLKTKFCNTLFKNNHTVTKTSYIQTLSFTELKKIKKHGTDIEQRKESKTKPVINKEPNFTTEIEQRLQLTLLSCKGQHGGNIIDEYRQNENIVGVELLRSLKERN
jgi:hypothetical protein